MNVKVEVTLKECVEFLHMQSGDARDNPYARAIYMLAAHTLKGLTSKHRKYYTQKVALNVEMKDEGEMINESNSIS